MKKGDAGSKTWKKERSRRERRGALSISHLAARIVVKKAGELVGIRLRPHDLRRHAATYASRAGTPLEILSKAVLSYTNLATQRYLGKVTDLEAMKCIESLHG